MDRDDISARYQADEVIAGRYRIVKVLGVGGMGVVIAARHLALDSLVAIKLLRPEVLSNRSAVERFAAEARAAVRIKSEHVARVTDVSTLPDGAPYMVMEHLEGVDLAELIEKGGPLAVESAVDYLLQACEALAEAHSLGIIHRDLKPGNLFLSKRADGSEIVKVLDFGISKSTDVGTDAGASLTSTGVILGSPIYMSPEQLSSSKTVDHRTDIWAIGVILHQILSGQLPFKADTLPQLFMAIVQERPPPLRSIRPDVPQGLAALVLRCLEKDRERRFENVGQLAVALAPFAPQRSRVSVGRILRMAPSALTESQMIRTTTQQGDLVSWPRNSKQPGTDTQETWGHTNFKPERRKSKTVLLFLGALSVLAGGGGVLGKLVLQSHPPRPASSGEGNNQAASAVPARNPPLPVLPVLPAPEPVTEPLPVLMDTAALEPAAESRRASPAQPSMPARAQTARAQGHSSPRKDSVPAAARTAEVIAPHAAEQATAPPPPPATRPAVSATTPPKPRSDWEEDRH